VIVVAILLAWVALSIPVALILGRLCRGASSVSTGNEEERENHAARTHPHARQG
jgi:hypothetical protein